MNFKKTISYDALFFVIQTLLSILSVPLFLKFISVEDYGIYLTVQSIMQLILLADFGMSQYVTRKFSNVLIQDIRTEELRAYNVVNYCVALFIVISVSIVIYALHEINYINGIYAELIFVFSFSYLFRLPISNINAVIRSSISIDYSNFVAFFVFFVNIILSLIFVFVLQSVEGFAYSFLLSSVVYSLLLISKIKQYGLHRTLLIGRVEFDNIKRGLSYTASFQFLRLSNVMKGSFFPVFLTAVFGPGLLASYNIYYRLPSLFNNFSAKMISNLFNKLSLFYLDGDYEVYYTIHVIIYYILFVFSSVVTAFLIFNLDYVVEIWTGNADILMGTLPVVISLLSFFALTSIPLTMYIQSSGKFKLVPYISIFELMCFLVFSYFQTPSDASWYIMFFALSQLPTYSYMLINLLYNALPHIAISKSVLIKSLLLSLFSILSIYFTQNLSTELGIIIVDTVIIAAYSCLLLLTLRGFKNVLVNRDCHQ